MAAGAAEGGAAGSTTMKLQTVTGHCAPMVGEAMVTLRVVKKESFCLVWVAWRPGTWRTVLADWTFFGLWTVINPRAGTLTFPDGHAMALDTAVLPATPLLTATTSAA